MNSVWIKIIHAGVHKEGIIPLFVFGRIKIRLPILLRTKPCDKPVITAKSQRLLVHQDDGSEDKVIFQFEKWERLVKIEVVTEDSVI